MNIVFRKEAYEDLDAIISFYALESTGFANTLLLTIINAISRLNAFPLLGRQLPSTSARHLVVLRSYSVIYVFNESQKLIEILAVFHEKELRKQKRIRPKTVGRAAKKRKI